MQIAIHALGFPLTDALRRHADDRLRLVLTRYEEHILSVVMRLSGCSSAQDKTGACCHVQVRLGHMADVVVEHAESDLYVAIGRAAHRAGHIVKRRLRRRRDQSRVGGAAKRIAIEYERPTW